MALAIGNFSQANQAPSAASYTFSHNQDVGADGFLLVALTMSNSQTFSGCTYGGQAMTQLVTGTFGAMSQNQAIFGLVNPPTGSNNIVASFSGNQWNPLSLVAQSFTGSGGAGAVPSSKRIPLLSASATQPVAT